MKKIFIIALILSTSLYANLSRLNMGGKTGINFNSVKAESDNGNEDTKFIPGFHMGFFGQYRLTSSLHAQVEFLYITKGFGLTENLRGIDSKITNRTQNLEIPILIKPVIVATNKINAYFLGGLYTAFAFEGSTKIDTDGDVEKTNFHIGNDDTDQIEVFDLGFKIGFEVQTKPLPVVFMLSYQNSFINLAPNTDNGEKIRNRGFEISVGYKFGKISNGTESIRDSKSHGKKNKPARARPGKAVK